MQYLLHLSGKLFSTGRGRIGQSAAMRLEYQIVLEFFFWGLEVFSRRDCALILAGYRSTGGERRIERLLERLRRQRLIEQRGRGATAKFTITARGRGLVRGWEPAAMWNTLWDGRWRVFTFDLPLAQNKQRFVLWRALRERKFGLLQQSVWLWPRDVKPILQEILDATGIPECFCGFEAGQLLLCDHAEVVAVAWDFEEITRRHETYLKHAIANPHSAERAGDLRELARVARVERDAYHFAFSLDPVLPRELWPRRYRGGAVEDQHRAFRAALARRLRVLAS
jgi:DNA-binding transcriptional regulator PaaX